jgi:hypothetical protein
VIRAATISVFHSIDAGFQNFFAGLAILEHAGPSLCVIDCVRLPMGWPAVQ